MAGAIVARKRSIQSRTKVKTGCGTCRIRKIKCDEGKPFCQKCAGTGRTCDGYESPFRPFPSQSNNIHGSVIKSGVSLQTIRPILAGITPRDVELLNRCFSTKTIFDVKIPFDEEARQVLQASLMDPTIKHAVSSLRALREDFETSGGIAAAFTQKTPSHSQDYGLQQYCMALGGLASNLSSPGSRGLKSALLCCQIFISIEQVRQNYSSMAQHMIQGLRIMHEYRARPSFIATNKLMPAHQSQLPLIDVFIIKQFAAPCRFSEPPTTANISTMAVPVRKSVESGNLRTIVPDMRILLTRIATSTLEFLEKVSHAASLENGLVLLYEKASLLDSLEIWLTDLELVQTGSKLLSLSFLRAFHQTLKIILLGALESSPDVNAKLQIENNRLRAIASNIDERLKAYGPHGRIGNGQSEASEAR